jgi:hypothetical protein
MPGRMGHVSCISSGHGDHRKRSRGDLKLATNENEFSELRRNSALCRPGWVNTLSDFAAVGPFPQVSEYERLERLGYQMEKAQRRMD